MAHILVVDDEADTLIAIGQVLEDSGHEVTLAASGQEAIDRLARKPFDLVVLDVMMPDIDGIQVCRRIRADPLVGKLPVIFLTAKDLPLHVAQGLDAGGDDYLTKPFDVVELPARIRALLRRSPGGLLDPLDDQLTVGRLRLQFDNLKVWVDDRVVELTPTEHRLLCYLMSHAGQPVSADHLLEDVWEYPPGVGDPKLVAVHIGKLRRKLAFDPDTPQYIQNLHGRGYMISR